LATASPAKALTITADDQGWYDPQGFYPPYILDLHLPWNTNYLVGCAIHCSIKNFFVFSLPNSPISSASLTVDTADVSDDSQIVSLFGFSGSIADLVSGTISYSALGQGPSFASLIYNMSDSGGAKTFTFNPAGVSYLNSLTGGQVAITGDNPSGGYVYGSSGFSLAILTLNEGLSQSVPGPLPVFGVAAAFQASRRLKSRIRQSSRCKMNGSIPLNRVGIDA
jgi:hypothetical protein